MDPRSPPLGPGFARLWAATSTANLADGIVLVGFPLLAVELTRSPWQVSLVTTLATAPWLLVALPAGALADRHDRRRLLLTAMLLRVVVLASLTALALTGAISLPVLYLGVVLLGVAEVIADTTSQSILPMLVSRDRLGAANGRIIAAQTVANDFLAARSPGSSWGSASPRRWSPRPRGTSRRRCCCSGCAGASARRPARTPGSSATSARASRSSSVIGCCEPSGCSPACSTSPVPPTSPCSCCGPWATRPRSACAPRGTGCSWARSPSAGSAGPWPPNGSPPASGSRPCSSWVPAASPSRSCCPSGSPGPGSRRWRSPSSGSRSPPPRSWSSPSPSG
jgi:hypothetical protein